MNTPVLFHSNIRERLKKEYQSGVLPQSLLFTGQYGVGKETMARWLVRDVIGCIQPDLVILGADRREGVLGIEEVRELREHLARTPLRSPHTVAVILDAQRLTLAAQQASLKSLEEPRTYTRIILTATRAASLVSTIRSRVVEIPIHLVPHQELAAALAAAGLQAQPAEELAIFSRGCPGVLWARGALRPNLEEMKKRSDDLAALRRVPFWRVRQELNDYFDFYTAENEAKRIQVFERIYAIFSPLFLSPPQQGSLGFLAEILAAAHTTASTDQLIDAMAMAISHG